MKNTWITIVASSSAWLCFCAASGAVPVMNVDFDNSGAGPTQSGYTQYAAGTSPQVIAGIEVAVSAHQSRDRGAFTNPLADLARDFLFSTANLTLGSVGNPLPAGLYKFTGYHHDVSAGAASGSYTITDEERSAEPVLSSRGSSGTPANASDIARQEVLIRSDGSTPVQIDIGGIDGFDLETTTAPEELKADHFGSTYANLQSGYQAFDPVGAGSAVLYYTQAGVDDVVRVKFFSSATLYRDFAVTHALEDLLVDYNAPTSDIVITLFGLKAGTVNMTTYHHGNASHGGTYDIVVDGNTVLTGISSGSGGNPTITNFQFTADGVTSNVVTLDLVSGRTMINGFDLSVSGGAAARRHRARSLRSSDRTCGPSGVSFALDSTAAGNRHSALCLPGSIQALSTA